MAAQALIAVFPYLKTSQTVRLRGIEFRSSENVDGFSCETQVHLDNLLRMFYLQGDMRIDRMSYACLIPSPDGEELPRQLRALNEISEVICYLYSAPHPTSGAPFLRQEHSSLFCFSPASVPSSLVSPEHNTIYAGGAASRPEPDDRNEVPGYEVRLNGIFRSWVVPGSRIYPPALSLWLNISQDLSSLCEQVQYSPLHRPLGELLSVHPGQEEIPEGILTALRWYNRSLSISAADEVVLVHLAIAFESLLGLEQAAGTTERFKEGVLALVGGFPRLESWLRQFYAARSEVVHQGRSAKLMFDASGPAGRPRSPYRPLVSFGRRLFQVCLSARLFGALSVCRAGFSSWLTTNQERFERVCKCLSERGTPAAERMDGIADDVVDIEDFRFVPDQNLRIPTMLSAAKACAEAYLQTDPGESPDVLDQMRKLADAGVRTEEEHVDALAAVRSISEGLPGRGISGRPPHVPRDVFASLLSSVWHYCFMYYFQLVRSGERCNGLSPPESE